MRRALLCPATNCLGHAASRLGSFAVHGHTGGRMRNSLLTRGPGFAASTIQDSPLNEKRSKDSKKKDFSSELTECQRKITPRPRSMAHRAPKATKAIKEVLPEIATLLHSQCTAKRTRCSQPWEAIAQFPCTSTVRLFCQWLSIHPLPTRYRSRWDPAPR